MRLSLVDASAAREASAADADMLGAEGEEDESESRRNSHAGL